MPSKYLEPFLPVVTAIAETFGKNCEVVLHDFSMPNHSVIKIANGHITGRDVGSPVTDLVLPLLKENSINIESFIGYQTKTPKGILLKSTTIFIKNRKSKIVGALCINIDITPYLFAKNVLERLCESYDIKLGNAEADNDSSEHFEPSVENLIKSMIQQAIHDVGKPIFNMVKEDKLKVIRFLKNKGLFMIKGSSKRVSRELNVSLPTIYKYLEETQRT